jgi:hypothetical protein
MDFQQLQFDYGRENRRAPKDRHRASVAGASKQQPNGTIQLRPPADDEPKPERRIPTNATIANAIGIQLIFGLARPGQRGGTADENWKVPASHKLRAMIRAIGASSTRWLRRLIVMRTPRPLCQ